MHFVFDSNLLSYRNSYIQAKLLLSPASDPLAPNVYIKWDKAKPLMPIEEPLPSFQFEVRKNVAHPDNYWSGSAREPFSGKLLALLQKADVRFETFETEILERGTCKKVLEDYRVFRLLETFSLIDPEQVEITDNFIIKRMAFRTILNHEPPAMFRDENYRQFVFVSNELKKLMQDQNITGCRFRTLEERVGGK